ncbi:hypothetical protein HBI81_136330 [Parastagonospora nodorum]|nr:hypothetical protein HBH46_091300 [Parastagonospora nodorum]KAH4159611.1 hypothetical protein HBH44_106450 [Parastagonospora nodorum]KAH4171371.1 hypothetical protein HBH43_097590 [Parastagonospora nodorum]KAH4394554.1 hypothetical protein HBH99_138410 [Parastagonospora nodorum]KAH4574139.1 hypothetical protein HBH84_091130 [Parastagonospora nodorum]
MREKHNSAIDHELGLKIPSGLPLARANLAVTYSVVEVEMGIVLFPRFLEDIVDVFEKFLYDSMSSSYDTASRSVSAYPVIARSSPSNSVTRLI